MAGRMHHLAVGIIVRTHVLNAGRKKSTNWWDSAVQIKHAVSGDKSPAADGCGPLERRSAGPACRHHSFPCSLQSSEHLSCPITSNVHI